MLKHNINSRNNPSLWSTLKLDMLSVTQVGRSVMRFINILRTKDGPHSVGTRFQISGLNRHVTKLPRHINLVITREYMIKCLPN